MCSRISLKKMLGSPEDASTQGNEKLPSFFHLFKLLITFCDVKWHPPNQPWLTCFWKSGANWAWSQPSMELERDYPFSIFNFWIEDWCGGFGEHWPTGRHWASEALDTIGGEQRGQSRQPSTDTRIPLAWTRIPLSFTRIPLAWTRIPHRNSSSLLPQVREGFTKKSCCSSGFCPNILPPPNLDNLWKKPCLF